MTESYGKLPSEGDYGGYGVPSEPDDYDPDLAPTLIQGLGAPDATGPAGQTTALREAQELFDRHDYLGCVQRLKRVPSEERSPQERALKARAAEAVEEIGSLKEALRRGVKEKRYDGLLPKARRYLELKPDDPKYARLCAKLEALEAGGAAPAAEPAPPPALGSHEVGPFLLRYVQVGAFAGAVLGALIGGFWHPQGYFLGGLIGGIVAAVNELHGSRA